MLDESQSNNIQLSTFKTKIRSQEMIHEYLTSYKVPASIRKIQKMWEKELRNEANKRAKQLSFDVIDYI